MTLPLRQLEGKYEVLHKIKEGGMGAVYKVRHLLLEEVRVVKVIRPQFAGDEALQHRFLKEAKTAIRLRHPNIAQLYDFVFDEDDGTSFMVMEFIDGVTLEELVQRHGALECGLAVEAACQSLDALAYLHHQGFIHRDISPDNLMLGRRFDSSPQVKLIDLGIVKHLEAEGPTQATQAGTFLGKVRYSSPEAFAGADVTTDPRADLYSFGVVLYELLTGVCPVVGDSFSQIASAHLFQPPLPFERTDPQGRVASGLRRVVLKALEKVPADRFASAEEMKVELAPFTAEAPEVERELSKILEGRAEDLAETRAFTPSGTTPARIQRSFPPTATPPPIAPVPESARPSPPRGEERSARRQEIEERFAKAQQLVREERYDNAEEELLGLLELDATHGEAGALLASVHAAKQAAQRSRIEEQARQQIQRRAEALLEQGELEQARQVLASGVAEYGEHAGLTALRDRVETAIAEARRAEEAERRAREAAARSARVDQALAAARRLLERDALEAAQEQLAEVRRLDPHRAELDDLRRGIEAARRRLRGEALLAVADEHLEHGRLARASWTLYRLQRLDPELPATQDLRQRLAAARTEARQRKTETRQARAEAKRAATVERAAQRIEALLAAGELDQAEEALEQTRAAIGPDPRWETLAEALGARQEALRRERAERCAALVAEARELRAAGDLAAAEETLRRALAVDLEHAEARDLLAALGAEVTRRAEAEQRRRREAQERERRRAEEETRRQQQEREEAERRAVEERRQQAEARERARRHAEEEKRARAAARAQARAEATAEREAQALAKRQARNEARAQKAAWVRERATARAAARSAPAARRRRVVWATSLLAVVAVAAAFWYVVESVRQEPPARVVADGPIEPTEPTTPAAAAPGTLVLDVLPWAEVESIVDQDGERHATGERLFTPLHLDLPPGIYTLTLIRPGAAEPREISVEVRPGERARRTVEWAAIDVETYFEKAGFPEGGSPES